MDGTGSGGHVIRGNFRFSFRTVCYQAEAFIHKNSYSKISYLYFYNLDNTLIVGDKGII